jgi:hypothetical protein
LAVIGVALYLVLVAMPGFYFVSHPSEITTTGPCLPRDQSGNPIEQDNTMISETVTIYPGAQTFWPSHARHNVSLFGASQGLDGAIRAHFPIAPGEPPAELAVGESHLYPGIGYVTVCRFMRIGLGPDYMVEVKLTELEPADADQPDDHTPEPSLAPLSTTPTP